VFFIEKSPVSYVADAPSLENQARQFRALGALANNQLQKQFGSNSNTRNPRRAVKYRPLPLLGGGAV
jgi:hypothetical protein